MTSKNDKPKRGKCACCGRADSALREDPYASEIKQDHTLQFLCDECEYQSASDI